MPLGRGAAPGCALLAWAPRLDPAHPLLAAGLYLPQDKLFYNEVSITYYI